MHRVRASVVFSARIPASVGQSQWASKRIISPPQQSHILAIARHLTSGRALQSGAYSSCLASGMACLSHAHTLLGEFEQAVKESSKAVKMMGANQDGLVMMSFAHSLFAAAFSENGPEEAKLGLLLRSAEAYAKALNRLTEDFGKKHPDRVACQISLMAAWMCVFGPGSIAEGAADKCIAHAKRLVMAPPEKPPPSLQRRRHHAREKLFQSCPGPSNMCMHRMQPPLFWVVWLVLTWRACRRKKS